MPFRNPIVAGEELIIPGIRSKDWVEAESGWRVGRDGSAQFNNMHILGNLGADILTADRFNVGDSGIWLPDGTEIGDRLNTIESNLYNKISPGFVMGGQINSTGLPTGSPELPRLTEVPTVILSTGEYKAAGWYAVSLKQCKVRAQSIGTGNAYIEYAVKYTTATGGANPVNPNTSSPTIGDIAVQELKTTYWQYYETDIHFYVSDADVLARRKDKCLLTFKFVSQDATGYGDFAGNADWFVSLRYVGAGVNPKIGLDYANVTPVPPPEPETDYNVTFQPQWSQSYGANSADTSTFKVNFASCLQGGGYYGYHCRSLVGYNWAAIDSLLTGLNNAKMYLTYKVKHTYYSAGTPISIGYHTFTSAPDTWNGTDSATANLKVSELLQAGDSKTVDITDWIPRFRDDSPVKKGITFGPKSGYVNYAYIYGATETGKPTIRITGRK